MTEPKTELISMDAKLEMIDSIGQAVAPLFAPGVGANSAAYRMADAMLKLRELMTGEFLEKMLALQGSKIGFRTDKDSSGGYVGDIVRNVLIQAIIHGLRPIGNEFNIIAGELYITREGYTRLVRELPGFTDLKITEGKIESVSQSGCYVPLRAEWVLNGRPDWIEVAIPVRINAGMGQDAILGKANRKLLKRIYERVTGSVQSEPDDELLEEPAASAVIESTAT